VKLRIPFSDRSVALAAACVSLLGSLSLAEEKPTIKDISAVEARDYLRTDSPARDQVMILDIRTPEEFAKGHLKRAKNIDFRSADFKKQLEKLEKKRVYLMHCQSGGRSTRAKKVFKSLGFTKVLHIQDGYRAWASAGFPVEASKPAK